MHSHIAPRVNTSARTPADMHAAATRTPMQTAETDAPVLAIVPRPQPRYVLLDDTRTVLLQAIGRASLALWYARDYVDEHVPRAPACPAEEEPVLEIKLARKESSPIYALINDIKAKVDKAESVAIPTVGVEMALEVTETNECITAPEKVPKLAQMPSRTIRMSSDKIKEDEDDSDSDSHSTVVGSWSLDSVADEDVPPAYDDRAPTGAGRPPTYEESMAVPAPNCTTYCVEAHDVEATDTVADPVDSLFVLSDDVLDEGTECAQPDEFAAMFELLGLAGPAPVLITPENVQVPIETKNGQCDDDEWGPFQSGPCPQPQPNAREAAVCATLTVDENQAALELMISNASLNNTDLHECMRLAKTYAPLASSSHSCAVAATDEMDKAPASTAHIRHAKQRKPKQAAKASASARVASDAAYGPQSAFRGSLDPFRSLPQWVAYKFGRAAY